MLTRFHQIPLCRAEVSRAHSALAGTCIRLAECMGLHKDPSAYSTSPIECQVRRLIWHQVCFLDLRTCEATGPRCQVRPEDYDTRLPLNIDDIDLDRAEEGDTSIDVETNRPFFTDMTISLMRFECYEMHRYLWVERPRLERKPKEGEKKVTINFLLARIQSFTAAMEKKYLPMLSKTASLHVLASLIYGIISNRLYIQILQKYHSSDRHRMPDRLRQIVLGASIMILEHSQTIEQQPILATWSWYVGALHQYHTALLILNELYAQDCEPEMEQRAWRVLDFVFELGPGMTCQEKTRVVLEELIEKLQVYARVKRWRAPKNMPQAGPRTHTPGYQLQQQASEERARHSSLHPGSECNLQPAFSNSPPDAQHSPSLQQSTRGGMQPQLRSQITGSGAIAFPGAMPNADWGTFTVPLPPSISNVQQPLHDSDRSNFTTAMPSIKLMSPPLVLLDPTSVISQRTSLSPGAPTSTTSTSPMDALNDIDWVSAYHLWAKYDEPNRLTVMATERDRSAFRRCRNRNRQHDDTALHISAIYRKRSE